MIPSSLFLSERDFYRAVKRAIASIPEEIRPHLDNVLITVRKRPSRNMLIELGLSPDRPLLGLYVGAPLSERTAFYPPLYPDRIYIFQEPLEDICNTKEALEEQIRITVVHEIAHFLGISEERLVKLGYG